MSAAKTKTPAKTSQANEIAALFIKTRPGVDSFCRAGHRFNKLGHGIVLELLSEDQVAALKAEPKLIVEECTIPVDGNASTQAE